MVPLLPLVRAQASWAGDGVVVWSFTICHPWGISPEDHAMRQCLVYSVKSDWQVLGRGEREGSLYTGAQASDVIPDNPYPVIPCSIPHDKSLREESVECDLRKDYVAFGFVS